MKIAPGVRIRASSRGFSAGIGPRAARVHVGTPGVGVSTGVGPFGAYQHLGGGSRRRSTSRGGYAGGGGYGYGGPSSTTLAALERAARQAEKEEEIARVAQLERQLVSVHLDSFQSPQRRVLSSAPAPDEERIRKLLEREHGIPELAKAAGGSRAPAKARERQEVDLDALVREERKQRLQGVSIFKREERRQAKAQAQAAAEARAEQERAERARAAAAEQRRLDAAWEQLVARRAQVEELVVREVSAAEAEANARREAERASIDQAWELLVGNDPPTVIAALEAAFADNGAPATPIDCEGDTATVTMLYGHPDLIPERTPAVTPGGKPTLRKRTKSDCNDLYLEALASNVLATVKEGLAVCSGVNAIKVLVVRRDPVKTGGEQLVAVYAAIDASYNGVFSARSGRGRAGEAAADWRVL
jgi:hypothetical protein